MFKLYLCQLSKLPSEQLGLAELLLSDDESTKSQRFRFKEDRNSYVIGKALSRIALSEVLGISPDLIRYQKGEHGKPLLVDSLQPDNVAPIHFNLSHAGDWVTLVISDKLVGLDVENAKRKNDVLAIADRYFFGIEKQQLDDFASDAARNRFFDFWTLKESYMKARGEGISLGLSNFGFDLRYPKPFSDGNIRLYISDCIDDDILHWQFILWDLDENYRLALGIKTVGVDYLMDDNFHIYQPRFSGKKLELTPYSGLVELARTNR